MVVVVGVKGNKEAKMVNKNVKKIEPHNCQV